MTTESDLQLDIAREEIDTDFDMNEKPKAVIFGCWQCEVCKSENSFGFKCYTCGCTKS